MAYIGNSPALKYASFAVQHFTTSATTGYTLDNAVTNENGIALFVNNVRQQPGASYAYTVSGTSLTLSAATTTSDTMYCVFIGKAVQTVIPPVGSVATAQLAALAVTNAKVADDAIGVDELSATGTASSSVFLRGDNAWAAPSVADIAWQSVQTSTVTAVAGEGYPVNTTSGAITVDLPAGSAGDQVAIVDYAGTFDSNACTVAPNGSEKIEGIEADYTMETERQAAVLTYIDGTQGWLLTSAAPDPGLTPPPVVVNYLVVAGGGPSGAINATNNPGPGGAGGLRSTVTATGGGGSLETAITAAAGSNYTVTVGAGGSGSGNDGADSVFSTITSVGGGGGGGADGGDGNAGGSGGGGGTIDGAGGAGTANQGYAGGTGTRTGGSNYPAGGGGGAGAVGVSPANAAADGGAGGVGVSVEITGSSVYYAGGGGGGAKANPGAGGNGGGGAGSTGSTGTAGTANTGGGAGAGGSTGDNPSSNGGSGIVILRYSNTHTISNPGGGLVYATPADDGDFKVASFTSGTGDVQWNL